MKIGDDYFYPDLVFYNRLAKCFVIIDLKVGMLTHGDIGQMQMYVNYYKKTQMVEGENEPIGILLCAGENDTMVEMTLGDNKNVYASQYLTFLPTKEELIEVINSEKEKIEQVMEDNYETTCIKDEIPSIIKEVGFDFDWSEKDIWKLNYPVEEIDINILEWHFEIPFWNYNNKKYILTPNDVLNDKVKYKEEYDRIQNSDLSYPIDIMDNKGRMVILDGLHRLAKYKLTNKNKIRVRIIPREEINNIAK